MGLPKVEITFEELAKTAVARSSRGTVAIVLQDETKATAVTELKALPEAGDWTADNLDLIGLVFAAGAGRVLAVRCKKTGENYDIGATLDGVKGMDWDWCAAPDADAAEVVTWIKAARAAGYAHKAVVANAATAPDSEGIVDLAATSVDYLADGAAAKKTYTGAQFCPYVAGVLASISLSESATGYVFDRVVGVVGPEDAGAAVDAGKFVIMWTGTRYECARGVTSLTTTAAVPAFFKKIKHVEGADIMAKDIAAVFRDKYRGMAINTYDNKQALVADVIAYLKDLRGTVLSPTYDHTAEIDYDAHVAYLNGKGVDTTVMGEIDILSADTGDTVYLKANVQLVDVMEDMTMTITLN